jgi:cell division protein FtsB
MTTKKTRNITLLSNVLLILMGAVLLYLGLNFVGQVSVSHQRKEELQQLENQIAAAREAKAALEARLEYARSDAAVEEWARENGLTRPDEVPVVVVAPTVDTTAGKEENPPQDAKFDSPREAWWELFFGKH